MTAAMLGCSAKTEASAGVDLDVVLDLRACAGSDFSSQICQLQLPECMKRFMKHTDLVDTATGRVPISV